MRDRKGMDVNGRGGEEQKAVEKGEIIIRIIRV